MISAEQLQRFIPFGDLSEHALEELLPHFELIRLTSRSLLFKRGQQADYCHYLLQGSIDLIDDHFDVTRQHSEDEGNVLAIDADHSIHKYSAVVVNDCLIARLPRRSLQLINTWIDVALAAASDEETDWLEALLTSDLFSRIPPGNIQTLLARFDERPVTLGDVLIQEGDEGHECYVIKHGKAVVTRSNGKQEETLAALGPGTLFGEDALISNLPRSATITMSSNGTVMVLSKTDFDTLLKIPVLEYVDNEQLNELIEDSDTGIIQLDVRPTQELIKETTSRARNVPLTHLRSHLDTLNRDFIYVVQGDNRAEAAAYILSEAGFEVKVLR